jgi:hypothetical protein
MEINVEKEKDMVNHLACEKRSPKDKAKAGATDLSSKEKEEADLQALASLRMAGKAMANVTGLQLRSLPWISLPASLMLPRGSLHSHLRALT